MRDMGMKKGGRAVGQQSICNEGFSNRKFGPFLPPAENVFAGNNCSEISSWPVVRHILCDETFYSAGLSRYLRLKKSFILLELGNFFLLKIWHLSTQLNKSTVSKREGPGPRRIPVDETVGESRVALESFSPRGDRQILKQGATDLLVSFTRIFKDTHWLEL